MRNFSKIIVQLFLAAILNLFCQNSNSQCIAEAGSDTAICVRGNTLPEIFLGGEPTARNGHPPYIYTWACNYRIGTSLHFSASDFLDDTTSANPAVINSTPDPDSLTFYLTVRDSLGFTCEDSVTITFCKFVFIPDDKKAYITRGDTIRLYPGVGAGCAPLQYFWFPKYNISNPDTATPLVWPDSTTFYYAAVLDSAGCKAFDEIFEVYVFATGTGEYLRDDKSIIFPNPVAFNSKVSVRCEGHCIIKIYDVFGRQKREIEIQDRSSEIYGLEPGLYYYRLIEGNSDEKQGKLVVE